MSSTAQLTQENASKLAIQQLANANEERTGNKRRASRGKWSSKTEFLFSSIGFTVGVNNLLVFPVFVQFQGRVVFLIIYFIVTVAIIVPMYFMEISLAQFSSSGPVSVWNCIPAAKALGIVMVIKSALFASVSNILMAQFMMLVPFSFHKFAPWNKAPEIPPEVNNINNCTTCNYTVKPDVESFTRLKYSEGVVFYDRVSKEIMDVFQFEGINLALIFVTAINSCIMHFIIKNGSKSIGKAVYYTATIPYMFITILIVKSCSLEGAQTGLIHLLTPRWNAFLDIKAWMTAAVLATMNLGMGSGVILSYGSYNKFKNNSFVDAMVIPFIEFVTCTLGTVVFYAGAGHLQLKYGTSFKRLLLINKFSTTGLYLDLVNNLPYPTLWLWLFFVMFYFLLIDTTFGYLETVISALVDEIKYFNKRRKWACVLVCAVSFLLILPLTYSFNKTRSASVVIRAVNWFTILTLLLEVTSLMWLYGVRNFSADISFMLKFKVPLIMKFSWAVLCPLFFMALLVQSGINLRKKSLSGWFEIAYWVLIVALCLLPIVAGAIYVMVRNRKEIKQAFRPNDNWGPSEPFFKQKWKIERGITPMNNLEEIECSTTSESKEGALNPTFIP